MNTNISLVPLLVVREAARAIDFYVRALGAKVLARYEHGTERRISHADLALEGLSFAVTEEARAWNSDAPPSLGGSPVVLQLGVADAEAVVASLLEAGATVIFSLQEFLGERMARIRDPFGHVWLLRQRLQELSTDEIQRQRDELYTRVTAATQAPVEEKTRIHPFSPSSQGGSARVEHARIHLVIGPVGAGKSTYALGLARDHGAVRLTLDEWMATLFRQDRREEGVMQWYVERAARCIEQIWMIANAITGAGSSVILEIGLLRRQDRERFYRRIADAGLEMTLHVLDASRDVRRERVNERNQARGATFSMVMPPAIFEVSSDFWEPPEADECEGRDVRFIRADVA